MAEAQQSELSQQRAELKRQRAELKEIRDVLAHDRTLLAQERTFAAWMRTGLGAMAGGFVIAKLAEDAHPRWLAIAAGLVLVVTGAAVQAAGYWEYRQLAREMNQEGLHGMPGWLILALSLAVAFSAIAIIVLVLV